MPVILPDRQLSVKVKVHPWHRDSHGVPVSGQVAFVTKGPWPGKATELDGGNALAGTAGILDGHSNWSLRVDPEAWPLREGDEVTDGTFTWTVVSARLHVLPGHPDVDYVAVMATLTHPLVP